MAFWIGMPPNNQTRASMNYNSLDHYRKCIMDQNWQFCIWSAILQPGKVQDRKISQGPRLLFQLWANVKYILAILIKSPLDYQTRAEAGFPDKYLPMLAQVWVSDGMPEWHATKKPMLAQYAPACWAVINVLNGEFWPFYA